MRGAGGGGCPPSRMENPAQVGDIWVPGSRPFADYAFVSLHTREPDASSDYEVSYAGYSRQRNRVSSIAFPIFNDSTPIVVTHYGLAERSYGRVVIAGPINPTIHLGPGTTPTLVQE